MHQNIAVISIHIFVMYKFHRQTWIINLYPRVGRGWGGGEGVGGGYLPIYGIVRMCVPNSPLFRRCQVYDWPPFFNKKYMNNPIFLDSYVKDPIFLTTWYIHIFFAQRFFEAAC